MTNKRSKVLTFFISLIPGAGEMFLGFYKMGASIMIIFWGIVAFSNILFPPLFYLLPILWFYSFFHTNNLNTMPAEEFFSIEDDYLFHIQPNELGELMQNHRKPLAFLLIFMGISIFWNELWEVLNTISHLFFWSDTLLSMFRYWNNVLPRFMSAALIIGIGARLIHDKKENLSTPPYLVDKETENPKSQET